jgi:hypothetical protein
MTLTDQLKGVFKRASYPEKDSPKMNRSNLPTVKGIKLIDYVDENQLEDVMRLVGQDLSEPYSSECQILCSPMM